MTVKMFVQLVFMQFLLWWVQISRAEGLEESSKNISVQVDWPRVIFWITEPMLRRERLERPPDIDFLWRHHIPGLSKNKTKKIIQSDFIRTSFRIVKAKLTHKVPFYGMMPIFSDIAKSHYDVVYKNESFLLPQNTSFDLVCVGLGVHSFNITWIDENGSPLTSYRRMETAKKTIYVTLALTVKVESPSASYGCQFSNPNFESPITKWFNFTLEPVARLTTDISTCGQVTFSCLDHDFVPEQVDWILNGEVEPVESHQLTITSSEMELSSVACTVKNQNGVSKSHIDFNNSQIPDCDLEYVTVETVTLMDGTEDTGTEDTGTEDTGTEDTGTEDTGTEDTGTEDTGIEETGTEETETMETVTLVEEAEEDGTVEIGTVETGTVETVIWVDATEEDRAKETGTEETETVENYVIFIILWVIVAVVVTVGVCLIIAYSIRRHRLIKRRGVYAEIKNK